MARAQPRPIDLLAHDGIRRTQGLQAIPRDVADDAHGQAGPGERLPPHDRIRQAQRRADRARFIFEEKAQRLDQFELHIFGQAAHVVMRLDLRRLLAFRPARFDHVGIQRALRQKARRFAVDLDRVRFALEQADELLADDLALLLRDRSRRPAPTNILPPHSPRSGECPACV